MPVTIPAAKAALLTALRGRPALDCVLVRRGLPAEVPKQLERIYIAGAINGLRTPPEPEGPRVEAYDIRLVVEVRKVSGNDPDGSALAEDRLWEIVNEIDQQTIDDEELAGAVWWCGLSVESDATNPTDDGWVSRALCRLHCQAVVR